MSEQIVTGKKYRILSDASQKIWHVISFITQAVDVFFSNGKNAQTTLGSITGISDSLTSTSSNVAASAASVKALNDKITELSSNLSSYKSGSSTLTGNSNLLKITTGFKPSHIFIQSQGDSNITFLYDVGISDTLCAVNGNKFTVPINQLYGGIHLQIYDDGFGVNYGNRSDSILWSASK